MKKIIAIASFILSISALANYYPNQTWMYSSIACNAHTRCPDGRVIRCNVYGMNYSNVPSYMSSQCRARVIQGRFVHCQGYVQQVNPWGNWMWANVNIPVSCY